MCLLASLGGVNCLTDQIYCSYQRGVRSLPKLLRALRSELPPKPRLPPLRVPPKLRFSRGFASFTFKFRPLISLPLNCATAASPASFEAISTKPKPRERPVSRSSITLADSTVPACENSWCKSSLEVWNERLPTYSFIDMFVYLSCCQE